MVLQWFKDVVGLGTLPRPPYSPTELYSMVLASFKAWPFLIPVLSLINAPHGRFAYESLLNINGNLGWFLMEIPSPIFVLLGAFSKPLSSSVVTGSGAYLPPLRALFSPSLSHFMSLPSANQVLVLLFVTHYTHRAVLQPLRSPKRSPMHITVPLSAILFNMINGFVMGSWLGGRVPWSVLPKSAVSSHVLTGIDSSSNPGLISILSGAVKGILSSSVTENAADKTLLSSPGLISSAVWKSPLWYLGIAGWAVGFASNVYHDEILMDLRRPNKTGKKSPSTEVGKGNATRKYSIPMGGLFEYVSFPNYLWEWFEWFSFAFAALYSLPIFTHLGAKDALLTALSTPPFLFPFVLVCLMGPRALNGHAWYKKTFGDQFPQQRKAIIPFLL